MFRPSRLNQGSSYFKMAQQEQDRWRTHVRTCEHRAPTLDTSTGLFVSHRDSVTSDDLDSFIEEFGQIRILDNGYLKIKFEVRQCDNDDCHYSQYFCKLADTRKIDWKDPHEV